MIELTEGWKKAYPGAVMGVLVMHGARNVARHDGLDRLREGLETGLRAQFPAGRESLKADPVIAAYEAYYRRFKKSYHVALQLESVIVKGRPIPSVSALVQAMFMAELSNRLLTAGHDLSRVTLPLQVCVASGLERYESLGGGERSLKEGDMAIRDGRGVISCILYGPDNRTPITAETQDLLFTVYAPAGIGTESVRSHLEDIQRYVRVVAPDVTTETLAVVSADQPPE
jgi:DNA/RNA-binding domain of Phe-tRNA-synthetase-like protein